MEDNSDQRVLEGEETIKFNFGSALVHCSCTYNKKLRDLLQAKDNNGVLKLMEAYKAYKANYLRNMLFDPSTPGLSMCLY